MGPVITNPYRILGLQATATRREFTKRIDDLRTRIEFGKSNQFPLDFSTLFPLVRTVETVDDAAKLLDNDERKLLHAFFWFIKDDSVDELALECLENNHFEKACEIWRKQVLKSDVPHFSWLINYSTILFLQCYQSNEFEKNVHGALQILGSVVTHKLDELAEKIFQSTVVNIDKNSVGRKLTDIILDFIHAESATRKKENSFDLLSLFTTFPDDTKQYLLNRMTAPHIKILEEAIAWSRKQRKEKRSDEIAGCNALLRYRDSVNALFAYRTNYRVKSVLNDYACEVLDCSIYANNELDDTELAIELLNKALLLPSWDETADRIAENKQLLTEIQADKQAQKQFASTIKYSETPIKSLAHAKIIINVLKNELDKGDHENSSYLIISSVCANNVLNYLIDQFNQELALFESAANGDIARLHKFIDLTAQVITLTHMLHNFKVDEYTKNRLNKNLESVNKVYQQLNEISASVKTAHANKKKDNIRTLIGWGILLIILFAIFS